MKTNKTLQVLTIIFLVVYLVCFYFVKDEVYRHVLIYISVCFGLMFSLKFTKASLLINGVGIVLLFLFLARHWPGTSSGLGILLLATSIIPVYFDRVIKKEERKFKEILDIKTSKYDNLIKAEKLISGELEKTEEEIDKINQFYIIGREVVEHMEFKDVAEHLSRVLSALPGVKSVAIFSVDIRKWSPLYFSLKSEEEKWIKYLREHENLLHSRKLRVIDFDNGNEVDKKSVLLLPVRFENELLSIVFAEIEKELADYYIERAPLFVHHVAMGLKRARLFSEVKEKSRIDGLTGLYLRRYFLERLNTEIRRAKRYSMVFAIAIMDVDNFKLLNDTYGHLFGDEVLGSFSKIILECLRPGDTACRFGGEEFICLLPLGINDDAVQTLEKIRFGLSIKGFHSNGKKIKVTISAGISYYPADSTIINDLIKNADKALYWVKENGRNGIKKYGNLPA